VPPLSAKEDKGMPPLGPVGKEGGHKKWVGLAQASSFGSNIEYRNYIFPFFFLNEYK